MHAGVVHTVHHGITELVGVVARFRHFRPEIHRHFIGKFNVFTVNVCPVYQQVFAVIAHLGDGGGFIARFF